VNVNVDKTRREMRKVEKTRINPSDKSGKREREKERNRKRGTKRTRARVCAYFHGNKV